MTVSHLPHRKTKQERRTSNRFHCSSEMPEIDPAELPSADLEALLRGGDRRAMPDDALGAWLEGLAVAGRHPSIDTASAYVVYRAWCRETGHAELEPFAFARLMLTRFRKRAARCDGVVRPVYLVSRASAERLRAAALRTPAGPEDRALFSFAELRRARRPTLDGHPALHPETDAAP